MTIGHNIISKKNVLTLDIYSYYIVNSRPGGSDSNPEDGEDVGSLTAATSVTSGTVYSLIETAHPVFGKVKRLWNSSVESHREVCALRFIVKLLTI